MHFLGGKNRTYKRRGHNAPMQLRVTWGRCTPRAGDCYEYKPCRCDETDPVNVTETNPESFMEQIRLMLRDKACNHYEY